MGLREVLDQPSRLGDELRDARGRTRQHQLFDPAGSPDHVVDRQPAAPGLPEEVTDVEAERGAHLVDLLDGAVDRPQRRVVGLVGAPAAELVVDDRRTVLPSRSASGAM